MQGWGQKKIKYSPLPSPTPPANQVLWVDNPLGPPKLWGRLSPLLSFRLPFLQALSLSLTIFISVFFLYFLPWSWYNMGGFFCGSLHSRLKILVPFYLKFSWHMSDCPSVLWFPTSAYLRICSYREGETHTDASFPQSTQEAKRKKVDSEILPAKVKKMVQNFTYEKLIEKE